MGPRKLGKQLEDGEASWEEAAPAVGAAPAAEVARAAGASRRGGTETRSARGSGVKRARQTRPRRTVLKR